MVSENENLLSQRMKCELVAPAVYLLFSDACKKLRNFPLSLSKPSWGSCPAVTHKSYKKLHFTVSLGEPRILQAPNSDVSLSIPQGSPGTFCMTNHTDFTKFMTFFPADECVISPMIEVNTTGVLEHLCTITLPHCIRDERLLSSIRVRRHTTELNKVTELPLALKHGTVKHAGFEIDQNVIRIHTNDFSIFTCSSCNKTTCRAAVIMFLFARLNAFVDEAITTTDIKAFLCCNLYSIKEFKQVRDLINQ